MIDTLIESGFAKENRNMTVCIYFLMNLQSSKKATFPVASLSAKS